MDLLRTAVVDATTLVAICHALKSGSAEDEDGLRSKLRGRLRRDIERGTVAYIDTLARTGRGVVDGAAAPPRESAMALLTARMGTDELRRLMAIEAAADETSMVTSVAVLDVRSALAGGELRQR